MKDDQLDTALKSMGMGCFVRYYHLFVDLRIDRASIIETLLSENHYTENSCRTRTTHGRRIVASGRGTDALRKVIESTRVSDDIRDQARALL